LIRHFRPELQARMQKFAQENEGAAFAGGWKADEKRKGALISPGM